MSDDLSDDLTPMSVGRLIGALDLDSRYYHDGVCGYVTGSYDPATRVLTLSYTRDQETSTNPYNPTDLDAKHDDAVYQFVLIDAAATRSSGRTARSLVDQYRQFYEEYTAMSDEDRPRAEMAAGHAAYEEYVRRTGCVPRATRRAALPPEAPVRSDLDESAYGPGAEERVDNLPDGTIPKGTIKVHVVDDPPGAFYTERPPQ